MLVVTARLFKDNQLVGYRLSDGQSTQDLTKQQVWVYAKNKQITNVIAVGTAAEPSISGTNGFELKKLPEITISNINKYNDVFTTQDLLATKIRMIRDGIKLDYSEPKKIIEICKEQLKKDVESGKVVRFTCRSLSGSLEVLNTLADDNNKSGITLAMPTGEVLEKQKKEFVENKEKHIKQCNYLDFLITNIIDAFNAIHQETGKDIIPCNKISESLVNMIGRYEHSELQKIFDSNDANLLNFAEYLQEIIGSSELDTSDTNLSLSSINALSDLQKLLVEYKVELSNKEYVPTKTFVPTTAVIGYRVKYTGNNPISTYRITVTPEHDMTPYIIQPGQIVCLNRAEMSILCSNPLIGCTLKNGKIVESSKKMPKGMFDALSNPYFTFNNSDNDKNLSVNDEDIKRPVTEFVNKETIGKYFITTANNQTYSNQVSSKNKESFNDKAKKKGIFGAFKR